MSLKNVVTGAFAVVLGFYCGVGCAPPSRSFSTGQETAIDDAITIDDVINNPGNYEGREFSFSGYASYVGQESKDAYRIVGDRGQMVRYDQNHYLYNLSTDSQGSGTSLALVDSQSGLPWFGLLPHDPLEGSKNMTVSGRIQNTGSGYALYVEKAVLSAD